jgi:hypothetical protein
LLTSWHAAAATLSFRNNESERLQSPVFFNFFLEEEKNDFVSKRNENVMDGWIMVCLFVCARACARAFLCVEKYQPHASRVDPQATLNTHRQAQGTHTHTHTTHTLKRLTHIDKLKAHTHTHTHTTHTLKESACSVYGAFFFAFFFSSPVALQARIIARRR